MMRRRAGASHTTICPEDVETCSPVRNGSSPTKSSRRRGYFKSCCWVFGKRLCIFCLFVAVAYFGYNHFQRAYTLYNLPGVKELLDVAPRVLDDEYIVFLTASTGEEGQTYIEMGRSSRSPTYALMKAQAKLPKKFHPWVKIDIVDDIERIEDFNFLNAIDAPGNFFGISLDWTLGWAFLPDEIQARGLMGKEQVLRWERVLSYARSKKLKGWPVPDQSDDSTQMDYIDVFHTQSVFYDLDESEPTAVPVYHGHRMYDELSTDILQDATINAGEHMAFNVEEDGTMTYEYLPRSDVEPDVYYNLTRHAAALYAMCRLYSKWQDPELLEGIQKAMGHLVKYVQTCPVPSSSGIKAKCVVESDEIDQVSKLGINALTVLAIAEYMEATKDHEYFTVAKDLSVYIEGSMRVDGSFVHLVALPHFTQDENHFVRFYHGQVAFALSRLYNVVKHQGMSFEESWAKVAVNAIMCQVSRDENEEDSDLELDQWLLYAIVELPRSQISTRMVDHTLRSIRLAVDNQSGEDQDEEALDELGIFYDDLSVTTTATHTEGLCSVYHLAQEQGRNEEVAKIIGAVTLGLRHQLQTQYQPENAMYMRNPKRILGAFHESIIHTHMRLDYTYHNLCSLLCAADMLADWGKKAELSAE